MQPAEARARIESDIGEAVALDQIDDDVGLPAGVVLNLGFHRAPPAAAAVFDQHRRVGNGAKSVYPRGRNRVTHHSPRRRA